MGGGVSLGSFSGSALTEALKLLIIYGKDGNKKAYDKVIVDGMSGASAGAIALTIMLKCLIDYRSMIPLYSDTLTEGHLLDEIIKDYFEGNKEKAKKYEKKFEALKALQLAQKIQYKIWVNEVDSNKLYGKKIKETHVVEPNESFSLLDRKLLEDLTKKYLMTSDGFDISRRTLLDPKRVIFACSLTNLLPIELTISKENKNQPEGKNKLEENVLKSIGSDNHSELRVIDFIFDEKAVLQQKKETDTRWLKFCQNPDIKNPTHFDITDKKAWATISASAIGCGAFPIAFEPVMLRRFQQEFGNDNEYTDWPSSFIKIQNEINNQKIQNPKQFIDNSYFAEEVDNQIDYQSFNFPYIDGGTFNNEPIREAFKIGNFQDFGRETIQEERLILFVDPIVRKEQYHSFRVSAYSPIKKSDNGVVFKKEISKLLGNTSSIINVLTNQGSIKEEHKIIDIKENFELRTTIFDYLDANTDMSSNLNIKIIATAFNKINKNLKNGIISLGTRDPMEYFLAEIHKSCLKQGEDQTACLTISENMLQQLEQQINSNSIVNIEQVYDLLNLTTKSDRNGFAQTVFKVIADFALNTDGKNENAYRAAILPINKRLDTVELPGSEIQAFGGFSSLKARQYAFEFARLSALLSLKENIGGFRPERPFIANKGFKKLEEQITERIKGIDFYNDKDEYTSSLENNLFNPSVIRIKNILLSNKYLKFILLKVPFVATSLISTALLPVVSVSLFVSSIFKKSPWRGSNILKKIIRSSVNQINYLALEPVTISILSDAPLNKKLLIKCTGNIIKKEKAIACTKTINKGIIRYQYYYQVSLLEYIKQHNPIPTDTISQNVTTIKIDSQLIERLGLSLSNKVRIPDSIDGNLEPERKRIALENNYTDIIEEIRIDRYNLPLINSSINNTNTALHYSLKNLNYHVNPLLEIDVQKLDQGWYFKEETESLDKKLMR
ncbi:hypothetical protein GCM10022393_29160 [Aquimarina addita]|uniref:PNPLA domain-containing protein n=2 Tax=Aquimarina addita TaxID=870485 RepID=A0ABP6UMT5_9FLAO